MDRRTLLAASVGGSAVAGLASAAGGPAPLPKRAGIMVAFMISDRTNLIDTAGPWEVFNSVMLDGPNGHQHPFVTYTVAPTLEPIRIGGGLMLKPQYDIAGSPKPNVIVVPAQQSSDPQRAWLKAASQEADVVMSVCTGAFQLARAGLLQGKAATTHHDYFDEFAKEFPQIELRRGLRFVDNGQISTAGGLTSGIDLALHVVRRYFGDATAAATAGYLEHNSNAWRTARQA